MPPAVVINFTLEELMEIGQITDQEAFEAFLEQHKECIDFNVRQFGTKWIINLFRLHATS